LPQERLSIVKIKEVLRLHSLGLKQRQIARSCAIAPSTVSDYLQAAAQAKLSWPAVAEWDDGQLEHTLWGDRPKPTPHRQHPAPDFAVIHQELQSHPHATLQLIWEEYRIAHPDSYRYSRFCDLYRQWLQKRDVVLRQQHRAGEKLFVDYAGDTIPVYDGGTGEARRAALFVAVLGASSYTYAEATWTQSLPDWIGSHLRAFEFLGGVPAVVVPDNLRAGVTRACRYEPEVNRTYQEMAAHYGIAVMPARPYKPRDKAKAEIGVLLVERWIVAALRKQKFFALATLNEAITELLQRLNQRPFRKREGSRQSLFDSIDRPALRPLPPQRYEFGTWKTATANIDYHVELDQHYYSVPYTLTGQSVELRATATTVEIFHRGQRVASHPRSPTPYQATTIPEHRPKSHQRHLEWTPSRLIEWARTIGPATAQLVEQVMARHRHPEQGYRSCLGILRLANQYTHPRLEAAAQRACKLDAYTYRSIKSMLEKQLDRLPVETSPSPPSPVVHRNIRGADYFQSPPTPTAKAKETIC
jgi:transposase